MCNDFQAVRRGKNGGRRQVCGDNGKNSRSGKHGENSKSVGSGKGNDSGNSEVNSCSGANATGNSNNSSGCGETILDADNRNDFGCYFCDSVHKSGYCLCRSGLPGREGAFTARLNTGSLRALVRAQHLLHSWRATTGNIGSTIAGRLKICPKVPLRLNFTSRRTWGNGLSARAENPFQ